MRFLLSRRWALFALTVVVLAYGCYLLGQWQFHRLQDRETTNAQTRHNLAAAATPVAGVLTPGRAPQVRDEWRRVSAIGTYDDTRSTVIRYQTRDGASGVDIVTPLRTDDGAALLVDRGWLKTDNVGADQVDAPAPPSGRVRVVGYVRADATGDAATVTNGSARAVSSRQIARSTGLTVYGGFVDAEKESPAAATRLVPVEKPDLGNGPHFFYGLQWWFFGLLAVFGFCYLAYDERKKLRTGTARRSRRGPDPEAGPSEGAGHPTVDREHRAADEARSG